MAVTRKEVAVMSTVIARAAGRDALIAKRNAECKEALSWALSVVKQWLHYGQEANEAILALYLGKAFPELPRQAVQKLASTAVSEAALKHLAEGDEKKMPV